MDLFRWIDSSVAWEILTPWKSGSYWHMSFTTRPAMGVVVLALLQNCKLQIANCLHFCYLAQSQLRLNSISLNIPVPIRLTAKYMRYVPIQQTIGCSTYKVSQMDYVSVWIVFVRWHLISCREGVVIMLLYLQYSHKQCGKCLLKYPVTFIFYWASHSHFHLSIGH